MKATAAVLRSATGPYSLETVTLDELAPDGVLVRVVGVGHCHTDVVPRAPETFAPPPIIAGHEGSGVVEAIGSAVSSVKVGDHVVMSFDSCGACDACTSGDAAYCTTFFPRNLTGRALDGSTGATDDDGKPIAARWFGQSSFATYSVANERNVVVVDPSLPLEKLGPLGCSVQTGAGSVLVSLNVQPGSSLVVFGAGAVGLSAVMGGVVAEAAQIVAVDINPDRLALASELGATHTIDGNAADIADQIIALTGGAQYAFDTTGIPAVIKTAIASLRMTGVLGLVAVQQGDLVLGPMDFLGKTIMSIFEGSALPQTFIPRMIDLWQSGRFPFDRLITTFPLSQINEAEQAVLGGQVIKPVLLPGA